MQNTATKNNWCIEFVWPTDCFTTPLSFSNHCVPKRIWSKYIWVIVSWFFSVKLKKICTCRYCLSASLNYLAVHTQSWKSFFPSDLSCYHSTVVSRSLVLTDKTTYTGVAYCICAVLVGLMFCFLPLTPVRTAICIWYRAGSFLDLLLQYCNWLDVMQKGWNHNYQFQQS